MNAREELISIIKGFTPEQLKEFIKAAAQVLNSEGEADAV